MCGRFVTAIEWSDIAEFYDAHDTLGQIPEASWNVAPTDTVGIVLDSAKTGTRRLEPARWGLVPPWAEDTSVGSRAINARAEEAAAKPTFREAVMRRRAIVPALGYYEWKVVGGGKQPYFVHGGGMPLPFAGLYEWWRDPAAASDSPDRWLLTATILTTAAEGRMAWLHDRVPLLLSPELTDTWLDPSATDGRAILDRVTRRSTALSSELEMYPVSQDVGSVRNNGPRLIEEVVPDIAELDGLDLTGPELGEPDFGDDGRDIAS